MGLQWGDIDFTGWFIEIKRTVSYRQHRLLVGSRKSGKARRVDMAKALAPRLQARRSLLEVEAAYEGRALPLWAFPNEVGGPLDAMHCLHRVWYPLLQKGGAGISGSMISGTPSPRSCSSRASLWST